MKTIFRIFILMTIVSASLGAFSMPASANTKEVFHYEFPGVVDPGQVCANGQILVEEYNCIWDSTIWRTDTGEFFRQEDDVIMTGKVYLRDQPWKVLNYEHLQWKNFFKPSGDQPSAGILMKMNIPGYGNIWHDIGHFVFEKNAEGIYIPVRLDGHHEYMNLNFQPTAWNYTKPCEYLTSLP
jgi:hypothetical protein